MRRATCMRLACTASILVSRLFVVRESQEQGQLEGRLRRSRAEGRVLG